MPARNSRVSEYDSRGIRVGFPVWLYRGAISAPTKIVITCPRCDGEAEVDYERWATSSTFVTRPCTYCFKTNRIPEEFDGTDTSAASPAVPS
jgi:hypothetical protein